MPTFDAHKNFAASTVATAPSPTTSGLSLTVATGEGVLFPATPFNATVWPTGVKPTTVNAEIVRVTNIAGDVLTIVRAQESTAARTIIIGDQIANTATIKVFDDIETAITAKAGVATFTLNDNYQRFTIADASVLSTSKIIGTLQRPNIELVDDPGWFYDYNVVKVANGSFDVMVYTSQWGEVADSDLSSIPLVIENLPGLNVIGVSDVEIPFTGDTNSTERVAYPITPTITSAIESIVIWMNTGGFVTGSLVVEIQSDVADSPSDIALGLGGSVAPSNAYNIAITNQNTIQINFIDHITLIAGTKYWIVFRDTVTESGNAWKVACQTGGIPVVKLRSSGVWSNNFLGAGPLFFSLKLSPIFQSELLTLNYLVL